MDLDNLPFNKGWYSIALPNRPCDGTYCYFPLESLPPVDKNIFDGSFNWLKELKPNLKKELEVYHQMPDSDNLKNLEELKKNTSEKNLKLPKVFLKIIENPTLQKEIPSCTAAYFNLSANLYKNPLSNGEGYFISFYHDQQDVLIWYLYLHLSGEQAVFCSGIDLELWESGYYDDELEKGITQEKKDKIISNNLLYCANSTEEFLYRIWIENHIGLKTYDADAENFTKAEQAYLKHYENTNQ